MSFNDVCKYQRTRGSVLDESEIYSWNFISMRLTKRELWRRTVDGLLLCLVLGKGQAQPLRLRVQDTRRIYTSQGQGGFTLGTSQVRIEGSKIHPRDFLGIGQGGSRMSHQFRAPAKALKESRSREGKEHQIDMTIYKSTEEIQLREVCSELRVYISETWESLGQ